MTGFKSALLLLTILAATACSDNESPPLPPSEVHTPESYIIQVNDAAMTKPYTFVAGETVRVRIKFFNGDQDDLDNVESSHFGGLVFDPASLATVVRVSDHNYQFDVTGGTAGGGTLRVGYGHDAAADEHTFTPEPANVTPGGGPAPSQ